ncbi:hypothetical protein [Pseudovibrio sp. Ad26]|uniref:hypothetical protein n=1 Tax=Pseudovibrio sp. Ad26 TaxID=989410 RepID=UPI0007AEBF61|nr:hypothetical protein [Pseudovibrio sp. Ad26]KZL05519.1 hypothetical protein PsAD26_04316 [Pseudovibrio sp. Ad26]
MSATGTAPAHFCDYAYSGPVQSVQLKAKNTAGEHVVFFEGMFSPGKTYTLPSNHPTIAAWVCGGILTKLAEASNG